MESLRENRPLMISLVATYSFIVLLALGWSSELCEQFGIIQFPEEVRIYYSFRAVLAEIYSHIHANKLNHKIIFFSVSVNFASGPSSGLFCFADFGSSLPFLVRGGKTEATINQLINIGQFTYIYLYKSDFMTEWCLPHCTQMIVICTCLWLTC